MILIQCYCLVSYRRIANFDKNTNFWKLAILASLTPIFDVKSTVTRWWKRPFRGHPITTRLLTQLTNKKNYCEVKWNNMVVNIEYLELFCIWLVDFSAFKFLYFCLSASADTSGSGSVTGSGSSSFLGVSGWTTSLSCNEMSFDIKI